MLKDVKFRGEKAYKKDDDADKFKNMSQYEIISISSVDSPNAYRTPKARFFLINTVGFATHTPHSLRKS